MSLTSPAADTRWRCSQCGNLTRFDVVRSSRVRDFVHVSMAGEQSVDSTEVLDEEIESIRCRWCGSDAVDEVPRPTAEAVDG